MKTKFFIVLMLLSFVVLGVIAWVMNDMDKKMNETAVKSGLILDAVPENGGLVLTVAVDNSLYEIHTNATNVKNHVVVVFKGGVPVAILQENGVFEIREWKKLKTLEKMPRVEEGVV